MIEQKVFSGWAYITRAPDVPGSWLAHFLDFDIMSVGDSPQHALEMVREAAGLALADDLNTGHDPRNRQADPAEWEPLMRLIDKHTKVKVAQLDERASEFKEFAALITVVLVRENHEVAPNLLLDLGSERLIAA